ncbi:potassium-transporting ATPase subunit KdpA [Nostoc muscorum FACHB-395]|nr:potassium-transporting ATPase subunit KdpA [Desmonostoc muscorum FACHB-395]
MFQGFVQIFLTLFLVVMSVPIAGHYLAKVFCMERTWLDAIMNLLERLIYLLIGIEPQKSMTGREYAIQQYSNGSFSATTVALSEFTTVEPHRFRDAYLGYSTAHYHLILGCC